ncbi:MAG: FAD-binding oxidoreductase [Betaproteobacteria bacterium]|nr:FAD-binding oxidoreductase [Betaproteobacteria bacterium]
MTATGSTDSPATDPSARAALLARLRDIVGVGALLTGDAAVAPHATDWRGRYHGRPLAVVKPATTAEVAAVLALCNDAGMGVVPQGGNTGLVGGATADASGAQLVLNLSRMNRIRVIDAANNTLTAEAGCVLEAVQAAAASADRLFPLSLASEGSCELGGNLSTNAGGTAVLRYGNARDLVLGLEVVLPDGEVWDGLRGLRKDNTGYDLKQLFIGAEGTLGVITAAVLKLFPLPRERAVAIVALATPAAAVSLLGQLQRDCGERLSGFELFSDACLELVLRHFPGSQAPLAARAPQYALVELTDLRANGRAAAFLEQALEEALAQLVISDAAVAQSGAQAAAFWSLRENISEAQAREGANIKHDVSLPISAIVEFLGETDALVARAFPGVRLVTFGHLGDGNLHYNVSPPPGVAAAGFLDALAEVNRLVHDQVARFRGSISAEHGLGQLKREEILRYKSPLEIALMRRIKATLDPKGIMNPGKLI